MSLAICIGACVYGYYSVCVSELATLISQKNNINSQEEFVYELSVTTSLFNFGAFLSTSFPWVRSICVQTLHFLFWRT